MVDWTRERSFLADFISPQIALMSGFSSKGYAPNLFDRELSWLAFNRRSFYEVVEPKQPGLERLLKLAQASAALDEYFMVRVPLLKQVEALSCHPHDRAFKSIQSYVRSLTARQQAHFTCNLRPHLAQQGIHLLDYHRLTDIQRGRLHHRFEEEIAPLLVPLITFPGTTIPDFSNLSLNLAICLADQTGGYLAWVKVPRSLARFMVLPWPNSDSQSSAVPLEQVIASHLPKLFPEFQVKGIFPFRVTRSANLGTLDSETDNLMTMIQESLQQRQYQGKAVRLEVGKTMPKWVQSQLMPHLQLSLEDTYPVQGWLGLSDLRALMRLPRPDLMAATWQPVLPSALVSHPPKSSILSPIATIPQTEETLFSILKQRDVLIHLPYHSFGATVERFVAQATADPDVLTIKMTLYRTAGDAPIVRSLIAAAKAGKQVVVLVELTAPLDEASNIHWARSLEKAGAHVVYGVVGLKTHTNLILIVRQEADHIHQYAYIGTGDYLPNRPQPYEDLGLLTSRLEIGIDLSYFFNFLTGCSRQVTYQTLMVAPECLRGQLKQLIARESRHAQAGKPARLIVKLNLLADPDMTDSLYQASQAGVDIDLIVRGICRLRPGVPGLSDRIRVVSILGRYVEHSRIVYCQNSNQPEIWFGTADWTYRGLDERIEVMAPIQSSNLVAEIQQWLEYWLADTKHTWILQPDGRYLQRQPPKNEAPFSAQTHFMGIEHSKQHSSSDRKVAIPSYKTSIDNFD
ncbi:MAG: polyphosphate kinase 1 [Cyanobacteria bacterium P01_F01_bin.86]